MFSRQRDSLADCPPPRLGLLRRRLGRFVPDSVWVNWRWDLMAGLCSGIYQGSVWTFALQLARGKLHATGFQMGLATAAPAIGYLFATLWARQMEGRSKLPFVTLTWTVSRGLFLLTPTPVVMADRADGPADYLPAATLFVHLTGDNEQTIIGYRPGLWTLSGLLRLGAQHEPNGRVSYVRLLLDALQSVRTPENQTPAVRDAGALRQGPHP